MAGIEKRDLVLPLIVICCEVRADPKLLMVNGIKDGGWVRFHKNSCIFGDIDRIERSRAVLEQHGLILPLNVV